MDKKAPPSPSGIVWHSNRNVTVDGERFVVVPLDAWEVIKSQAKSLETENISLLLKYRGVDKSRDISFLTDISGITLN